MLAATGYGLGGWGATAPLAAAPMGFAQAPCGPQPCVQPCTQPCAECPPQVENRQFAYQYPAIERSCDQHYTNCTAQVRDNNHHIIHDRVILNNINRHHHHVNRIYVRDNVHHHYNTNNVLRVNDIHKYRNEHLRAPGRSLADYKETKQVERGVCRNAGIVAAPVVAYAAAPAAVAPAPSLQAIAAPPQHLQTGSIAYAAPGQYDYMLPGATRYAYA